MQEKIDKFNAFIEIFKQLPVNIGNVNDYSLTIKNNEMIEVSTIKEEWYGVLLKDVFLLTKLLDLQFFIDKKTNSIIVH